MIYKSAAGRELFRSASGVFMVLFAVLMATQAIRLLGQAAGGKITPDVVMALLGFAALGYLPIVLSLTLYLAVLLTFSRWYRDSEMVIWLAAGFPLTRWLGTVMRFAAPIVIVIAALSFFLTPWASGQGKDIRSKLDQRDDASMIKPGAFNESSKSDRVFFVEAAGEKTGEVRNVFISDVKNGRMSVIATASGRTAVNESGDQFLVLEHGRRYELPETDSAYRVMQFERYGVRIATREIETPQLSAHAMPTAVLVGLGSEAAHAELLWRIGVPASALILALLAVPLSFVNPRAGRASNLVVALLLYTVYSNLMGVSEAWVAQGRLSFEVGIWIVHAQVVLVLIGMLWFRTGVSPLRRLWGRK